MHRLLNRLAEFVPVCTRSEQMKKPDPFDRAFHFEHISYSSGTTGFEPAIFALTGQYVNRYTTSPRTTRSILFALSRVKIELPHSR